MNNLANKITIVRIALIPFIVWLMSLDHYTAHISALILFVIAAGTDKLDGYIARKYQQVTALGKLLDPLADKLLVTALFIMFVASGDVQPWMVLVILTREFAVTGLRSIAAADGYVIAASKWGKSKTVLQIVAIIVVYVSKLWPQLGLASVVTFILILAVAIKIGRAHV